MTIEFVLLTTAVLALLLAAFFIFSRRRVAQLLAMVEVVTLPDVASSHLGNTRAITVFLPPHYHAHEGRRYPVLYVNDGQDIEQLQLRRTLAALYASRRMAPIIAVAIPTNEERLHEYGTAVAPNAQGLGTKAAAYGRFLTEELMPLINETFRTCTNPAHTAILGASLGGLSAFDVVWNHPHLFGLVGVMSGSFWWRASGEETEIAPNQRIAHEMARRIRYQPGLRFWFQAATLDEMDDRDNDGVIDAIQDTLELIAELDKLGYGQGEDVAYVEVKGGRHNYHTWSAVLPHFLTWAFPV